MSINIGSSLDDYSPTLDPMGMDFSGGLRAIELPTRPEHISPILWEAINSIQSIECKARAIAAEYPWVVQWLATGQFVFKAPLVDSPREIAHTATYAFIDRLGCGGWTSDYQVDYTGRNGKTKLRWDGALSWVGADLDVGHGRPELQYTTFEDALVAAKKLRRFCGGAAEIRRSTGGKGIHVRVAIMPLIVPRDGRAKAACIAKWLINKVGLRCDSSVAGRQNLWFWTLNPGPRSFELVEECQGLWVPPPDALAEPIKTHRASSATRMRQPTRPAANGPLRLGRVKRAILYLRKVPPAISGENGHGQTFKAACRVVLGFDCSEEEALLAMESWNERCQPAWSEKDLRHKIQDAMNQDGERGYLLEKE